MAILKIRRHTLFLSLFLALVALLYTLPIFRNIHNLGIQDWDQHLFYHAVPRTSLLEYGQIPLWNPYYVGGTVLLANPQSRVLSPSFLLILLFGPVVGIKLDIWLHLTLGLLGMFSLARHYRLGRAAALTSAFIFNLSSIFALNLTVGMTWYLSVSYLPWAFLFYLKGLDNRRFAVAAGGALALMYLNGGAYPLAVTLLFLGVFTLLLAFVREYPVGLLARLFGLALLFLVGFGAIKLLPSIEFQRQHPRLVYDYSGYSLNGLRYALLNPAQTLDDIAALPIEQRGFWDGVTGGMDENGMYVGLLPLGLALLGLRLGDRRRFVLFVSALVFLWISLGNRPRAELWSLLHLLPVYNSMRIAQRFRIVPLLALAIFAGFGVQWLRGWLARRWPAWGVNLLSAAIPGLILLNLLLVSRPILAQAFTLPPVEMPRRAEFTQVWETPSYSEDGWLDAAARDKFANGGSGAAAADAQAAYTERLHISFGSMFPAYRANLGVINGYESANVPRRAVPQSTPAYRGEAYLQGTSGSADIRVWSPNRLAVDVSAEGPGWLVINQNFYTGWHARVDGKSRQVQAVDGLLAVPLRPGDSQVALWYLPASFVLGAVISLLTLAGVGVLVTRSSSLVVRYSQPHFLRCNGGV